MSRLETKRKLKRHNRKLTALLLCFAMLLNLTVQTIPVAYATDEAPAGNTSGSALTFAARETSSTDSALKAVADDEGSFTAKLYAGQDTTKNPAAVIGEDNSATLLLSNNLLQIEWKYDLTMNNKLEITVPAGLYISSYTGDDQGNATSLQAKFETLNIGDGKQGTGNYSNAQTGTLTYTATGEGTETLNLLVNIDQTVWDKTNQNKISISGNNPAITISAGTMKKELQSVYTSEDRRLTHYIDEVKTVETGKSEQKAFQYRFLTGNRTPETVAWKKVTLKYSAKVTKSDTVTKDAIVPVGLEEPKPKNADWKDLDYSYNEETGEMTVTYSDFSQTEKTVDTFYLGYPTLDLSKKELSELKHDDQITVTSTMSFTSYYGTEYTVASGVNTVITVKEPVGEISLTAGKGENVASWAFNKDGSYLSCLGNLGWANVSFGKAYDAEFKVQFGENLRVQYYRVPLAEETEVTVTLGKMGEDGAPSAIEAENETKTITLSPSSNELNVLKLGCSTEYYIKGLTYTQEEIAAEKSYGGTSARAYNAPGVVWGNVYGDGKGNGYNLSISGTYYRASEDSTEPRNQYTATAEAVVPCASDNEKIGHHAYITKDDRLNSTTIDLGGTATIASAITIHGYPYGGSNYMEYPIMYAILPDGIRIENVQYGKDKDNKNDWKTIRLNEKPFKEDVSGTDDLWRIEFTETDGLGGYKLDADTKKMQQTDPKLYFSMELSADEMAETKTYDLYDRLLIGSNIEAMQCVVGGTEANSTVDSTILTETKIKYGAPPKGEKNELVVKKPTNTLSVQIGIKQAGVDEYTHGGSLSDAVLADDGDEVDYCLEVSNYTLANVSYENTAIYIPIIHKEQTLDSAMGGATPGLSAKLTGPVKTSNNNVKWDIRYSTSNTIYRNFKEENPAVYADGQTTWLTADQITDWSQVTMIKAVVAAEDNETGAFPKGEEDTLTFRMRVSDSSPYTNAIWNSVVWSKYSSSSEEEGSYYNKTYSTGIRAEMVRYPYSLALMATGGKEENEPDDYKTVAGTITLDDFSAFGVNNLRIESVTANNITLASPATIQDNSITDISEKDKTFAIELGIKGRTGSTLDLSKWNETQMLDVSNGAQTMTVTLTHFADLINATEPRSVDVVLTDEDHTMHIDLHIDIQRTVSVEAATGIVAGKHYNSFGVNNTSISVPRDGSFTIQIVQEANENATGTITLNFNKSVAGVRFLLIDQSGETPQYYSYRASDSEVALTSFTSLTGGGNYTINSEAKNLLIVADLSGANLTAGEYTCTAVVPGDSTNTTFTINVTSEANAEISFNATDGKYNITGASINDGRKLAVKFTLANGVKFPQGSYMLYEGRKNQYQRSVDGSYILVPLGDMTNGGSFKVTLKTPYISLDEGDYTLNAELYLSGTANVNAPLGGTARGTAEQTFTVTKEVVPAVRVTMDKRLLKPSETATATVTKNAVVSNWNYTLKNSKDGSISGVTASGNTITIPNTLPAGNYTLTVTDTSGKAKSSINFIVVDDETTTTV